MREPKTDFSKELRKLRIASEFTQSELAKAADLSASYVSQLETGDKTPTKKAVRKLSRPLGIKPNHLFAMIGIVEMDLAGTLAANRNRVSRSNLDLSQEQLEELADYLTYIEFKASTL